MERCIAPLYAHPGEKCRISTLFGQPILTITPHNNIIPIRYALESLQSWGFHRILELLDGKSELSCSIGGANETINNERTTKGDTTCVGRMVVGHNPIWLKGSYDRSAALQPNLFEHHFCIIHHYNRKMENIGKCAM